MFYPDLNTSNSYLSHPPILIGPSNVHRADNKFLVMVASSPSGNGSFYLLKFPCEPSHLLLKFKNGFISPHVMFLLKRNGLERIMILLAMLV